MESMSDEAGCNIKVLRPSVGYVGEEGNVNEEEPVYFLQRGFWQGAGREEMEGNYREGWHKYRNARSYCEAWCRWIILSARGRE